MFQLSKAVRQLFYANIAIFVAGILLQLVNFPFYETFALYPQEGFMVHQLITHQFLHGGFLHILFNMLVLVSIAPTVEDYLGYNKFLLFFGLIGLKSKYLVSLLFASEIYLGFASQGDGIGHFAHIGGGLTGIILVLFDKYLLKKINPQKRKWS